jgi:hypothetical protein
MNNQKVKTIAANSAAMLELELQELINNNCNIIAVVPAISSIGRYNSSNGYSDSIYVVVYETKPSVSVLPNGGTIVQI